MGCDILYIYCSLQPPPSLPLYDGGLSHSSESLYRRDIGQIGIFGEDCTLGRGDFFQVGLENSMYQNSEYMSQIKKMILIANIFFVGAKLFFASFS